MSRVNPRVGVVSGSEAETWDGGVGVPWLPCVHPLSHSSSGAEIRPLNSTASSSSVGPCPRPRRRHLLTASRPLSRVAPASNRGGRAKVRRRLLALNLHLEREQETGDALSPSRKGFFPPPRVLFLFLSPTFSLPSNQRFLLKPLPSPSPQAHFLRELLLKRRREAAASTPPPFPPYLLASRHT